MSSKPRKRNFKEWKPAAVAIFCGFFVWASGCGQRAPQDPAEAELRKLGKVQDSGCEDDLTGIFFIHSATLPSGAAAPSPDGARTGFAVGAAHTLLKTDNGGASWRRVFP